VSDPSSGAEFAGALLARLRAGVRGLPAAGGDLPSHSEIAARLRAFLGPEAVARLRRFRDERGLDAWADDGGGRVSGFLRPLLPASWSSERLEAAWLLLVEEAIREEG